MGDVLMTDINGLPVGAENCETLNKLYLEWSQFTSARTEREIRLYLQYNELIMAVARKHPGETSHETALRYIKQAELPKNNTETGQR